jgi:uncharacterized protein YaaQ
MKLVVAICRDEDAGKLSDALVAQEYRVTRVASTGGFMKRGNTTMLIGVDPDQVEKVIETLRASLGPPAQGGERRATVFVLDAARYEQV